MKCQLNTKLREHPYLEDYFRIYLNLNAHKNTVPNYNDNEQVFSWVHKQAQKQEAEEITW